MTKLTKKQKGFVKDYIDTGNATKAARKNYNTKTNGSARSIGSENLTKPDIWAEIEKNAEEALSVVIRLSKKAKNKSVQLRAAQDLLDRANFVPSENSEDEEQPVITGFNFITPCGHKDCEKSQN